MNATRRGGSPAAVESGAHAPSAAGSGRVSPAARRVSRTSSTATQPSIGDAPGWCARRAVFEMLVAVLLDGRSASVVLERSLPDVEPRERGWVQALTLVTLRFAPRLEVLVDGLLDKPLRARDRAARVLLLQGLAELFHFRTPDHAAVRETVALARAVGLAHLTGLVNAVLRRATRERSVWVETLDRVPETRYALPGWWLRKLREDWPGRWADLAAAALEEAPMTVRVNLARMDRDAARESLAAAGHVASAHPLVPSALVLETPAPVERLPGFDAGLLTVQDAAAQLAAWLVAPKPGERVLDACAAPGGKTGHLLEQVDGDLDLVAVERDGERSARIGEHLRRLGYAARVVVADLEATQDWWDGVPFDRILLDAPCSASGVVRRHPDIKRLRRSDDLPTLAKRQASLLRACWSMLKPSGRLVYATCSVFDVENSDVLAAFLRETTDAVEAAPEVRFGEPRAVGRAIALGELGMDGFYYAVLCKRATSAAAPARSSRVGVAGSAAPRGTDLPAAG